MFSKGIFSFFLLLAFMAFSGTSVMALSCVENSLNRNRNDAIRDSYSERYKLSNKLVTSFCKSEETIWPSKLYRTSFFFVCLFFQ